MGFFYLFDMSNICKLTGVLTDVFPAETKGNFTVRVFWLKQPDTERYPQHWQLELHNQDVDRLKGINSGDTLRCEVEIRGRLYTDRNQNKKIFVSLKCTGLEVLKRLGAPQGKQAEINDPAKDDDLPF